MNSQLFQIVNPTQYAAALLGCLGFVGWAVVGLAAVLLGARLFGLGWRFRAVAAGAGLTLQTGALIVLNVWEIPARPAGDLQFVGRFLERHSHGGGQLPTLYCSVGETADVLADRPRQELLHSRADLRQRVFPPDGRGGPAPRPAPPALRAGVALRFYVPFWPDAVKRNQEELFEAPLDVGPPTLEDLAAVCREDGVDYIAVPEAFDAPCAADNGRIYIYDCRQVRAALGSGRSTTAIASLALEKTPGDAVASPLKPYPPR